MLNKAFRINKNWEFENIYRKGRGFSSQFFGLNVAKNRFNFCRFGVVVSKKVAKSSVERNKLKRQTREILVPLSKKVKPGFDIIVTVRPNSLGADFKKLSGALEEIFKKANLL